MADYEATGEELEKLVRLGKKRPMPFAFCPPNGDDEALFATHRKKPPEMIAKSARKASGQTKVAFGFFTVEAKTMILVLHKELPQIAKRLKKHLKRERLWLNIKILDLMGNELEADIEPVPEDQLDDWSADDAADDEADTDDEAAPDAAADDSPDDQDLPDPAALAQRLKALEPRLTTLPPEVRAQIAKPLAGAVGLLRSGDLIRAEAAITAIERVADRASAQTGSRPVPAAPSPSPASPDPAVAASPPPAAPPAAAPPAAAQPAASPQAPASPQALALAQRMTGLQDRAAVLNEGSRKKVQTALAAAAQQIKAGNPDRAGTLLDQVDAAISKATTASASAAPVAPAAPPFASPPSAAPPPAAPPSAAQTWAKAETKLQPVLFAALASGKGDSAALRKSYAQMQALADAGDPAGALAAVPDLKKQLRAASAAPKTEPPVDVQLFVKSRQVWSSTRNLLTSEIGKLKASIDSTLAGMPDMAETAGRTAQLFSRIDRLDGRLEETLGSLAILPDGDKREAMKDTARRIISDYNKELDTPFFAAVDGGNGFASVKVRGPAMAALSRVSEVLA